MIAIAILFSIILLVLARLANTRLRHEERLPMQWWFNGEVTWSAPRALALAFIPASAVCVFVALVILSFEVPPKAGQEDGVLRIFIGVGVLFIAIQLLHLWLVDKTLRRNDD